MHTVVRFNLLMIFITSYFSRYKIIKLILVFFTFYRQVPLLSACNVMRKLQCMDLEVTKKRFMAIEERYRSILILFFCTCKLLNA